MSVNPGFGGQSFIKNAIKKVKQAKILLEEVDNSTAVIEVDGGINDITCVPIKKSGGYSFSCWFCSVWSRKSCKYD